MGSRRLFAALAVAMLLPCSARAEGPWSLAPGEYYSELSGSFISSGTFLDANGFRGTLDGLAEQRSFSSYSELGWKKTWSVQLGVPFVSRTVRSNLTTTSATSTGLGDFLLGLRRTAHLGGTPVALQITWQAPSGYNPFLFPGTGTGPGTASTIDFAARPGLQSLAARLQLGGSATSRAYWTLSGGFGTRYLSLATGREDLSGAHRPDSLVAARTWSNRLLAEASLGVWFTNSLLVTGQFRSDWVQSEGDLYDNSAGTASGDPARPFVDRHPSDQVLAGERVTYRLDDRLDAFAGSWHTPGGKNALHVDQYYVGIAWKQTKLNRLQGFLGGSRRP